MASEPLRDVAPWPVPAIGAPSQPAIANGQHGADARLVGRPRGTQLAIPPRRTLIAAAGNTRAGLVLVLPALAGVWLWTDVGASIESALFELNDWRAALTIPQRVAISAGIGALCLLALVLTWARAIAPGRPLTVVDGQTTARPSDLASLLEDTLCMHQDVLSARVTLENRGHRSVAVAARIQVGADTRLSEAISQVRDLIEESVREGFGLDFASAPVIDVRYDELNMRPKGRHGHPESA